MSEPNTEALGKIKRGTKVLCMCQDGNNRAVHCAGALKGRGYDAVAIGHARAGSELKILLSQWAEIIIVMQPYMVQYIPADHRRKLVVLDVGPDSYWRGWIPKLHEKVQAGLDELGFQPKVPA